jgi:hypothetical protein
MRRSKSAFLSFQDHTLSSEQKLLPSREFKRSASVVFDKKKSNMAILKEMRQTMQLKQKMYKGFKEIMCSPKAKCNALS